MSNGENQVTFCYSCLSGSLEKQAKQQGYILEHVKQISKLNEALNMLRIYGIITPSEANRATKRLHKMVCENLIPIEGERE
ncbi:hypothetical protein ACDL92_11895 [Ihubacter sp. mB4P-1]|uniref:hypothetical protein n=1 Tax=Ihubacter sp. mB4P-1 TaxID=3242370 RepID=UPI002170020A|nr:hypothetical protein [Emergencia sp.]